MYRSKVPTVDNVSEFPSSDPPPLILQRNVLRGIAVCGKLREDEIAAVSDNLRIPSIPSTPIVVSEVRVSECDCMFRNTSASLTIKLGVGSLFK